jgi:hypothetical protein
MGTGADAFFVINLVLKFHQFALQGRITADTLWIDLCLAGDHCWCALVVELAGYFACLQKALFKIIHRCYFCWHPIHLNFLLLQSLRSALLRDSRAHGRSARGKRWPGFASIGCGTLLGIIIAPWKRRCSRHRRGRG